MTSGRDGKADDVDETPAAPTREPARDPAPGPADEAHRGPDHPPGHGLEEVLDAYAPPGEAAAYLAALRKAEEERYATALLESVAHHAAGEPTDDDLPDPLLAEPRPDRAEPA